MTSGERQLALEQLARKYAYLPLVSRAKTIPNLVDIVTRQRVFDSGSRIGYGEALKQVLADDPELARAYARS